MTEEHLAPWTAKNLAVMRCIAATYAVPLTVGNARTLWLIAGLCDVLEQDASTRAALVRRDR